MDLMRYVQHNKGCSQKMAQTLVDSKGLELASQHEIMLEVMDTAQKSASKLRKLQVEADCFLSGSEIGCITRGHLSCPRWAT
jgi:hypothetical protein